MFFIPIVINLCLIYLILFAQTSRQIRKTSIKLYEKSANNAQNVSNKIYVLLNHLLLLGYSLINMINWWFWPKYFNTPTISILLGIPLVIITVIITIFSNQILNQILKRL